MLARDRPALQVGSTRHSSLKLIGTQESEEMPMKTRVDPDLEKILPLLPLRDAATLTPNGTSACPSCGRGSHLASFTAFIASLSNAS